MLIQGFSIRSIAVRASGAAAVATDEYFNLVALLLPGNGTNGAQNNTFLDSSTNAFTITRNGNTTQGTFSPFSQTGWSGYFDGSGDYLTSPSNAAVNLSTGDFTIEAWIYRTSSTGGSPVISNSDNLSADNNYFYLGYTGSGAGYFEIRTTSGSTSTTGTINGGLNTWVHIAVSRESGTVRLFVNGVLDKTVTMTGTLTQRAVLIGGFLYPGFSEYYPGYISNARIVKGTAVYTSAFTPPTAPLTAISGTSILTCQSNRFIDNSTNAFAITAAGNTAVQAFSPFDPTAAYAAATVGGSGYFDGTGDYLTTASSSNLALASGDFTIEMWVYPANTSVAYRALIASDAYAGTTNGWSVYQNGTNVEMYYAQTGGGATPNIFTGTSALVANAWQHVAVSRSSGTLRCFVNGVQVASVSNSINFTGNIIYIGDNNAGDYFYNGYLSNIRLVKGTAVYTSAFTPPTAPVTAIANTQLLLNYTNAGITDAAAKNVLETAGGAGISTTQSKWGGSAMAFDGSGDYLTFPITPLITSLGPTYTVEAWIYLANTTGVKAIYSTSVASTPNYGYFIFYVNGSSLGFYNRAATGGAETGIVAGTLSANTWTHVAISVNSNSGRLYINGTQVGSTTTINTTTFTPVYNTIGADILQGYGFNGYINDLRITRGVARYTANFTAPTTAFPTQ